METVKKVYSQNKFIVISFLFALICSEILCTVMDVKFYYAVRSSAVSILLRIAVLSACIFVAYKVGRYLSKEMLTFNTVLYALTAVLGCRSGPFHLLMVDYGFYYFFSFFALIFLSLYYTEKSTDSIGASLLYFFLGTVFVTGTYDEPEGFIALSMQLLLFVHVFGKIKKKAVRIIHIILSFGSLFALLALAAANVVSYAEIRFLEGSSIIKMLRTLSETVKPFGKAEIMSKFPGGNIDYNLARIFGFYGYVIGTVMLLIITVFVISIFMKAFEHKSKMKPLILLAAAVFSVRYFASIFINSGVVCGLDVTMPFICDGSWGYFVMGILLGLIFAADGNGFEEENEKEYEYLNNEEDGQCKARIITLSGFTANTD
ncbi:MAG: hypothetical protein IJB74_07005 [Clostridia bacterium]|nr:hypothetical protein [Clostridia bacterium]